MRDRVREAIGNVWGLPPSDVPPQADMTSMPDWDSLRHLELMLELEMIFAVRIPADEVAALTSVDAIETALRSYGAD
jgi:acyl carrier protein